MPNNDKADFFAVGRSFIDATHGRMRVAANDGATAILIAQIGRAHV